MTPNPVCAFVFSDGTRCQNLGQEKGLCFWHDPTQDKTGPEVKVTLERLARAGNNLEGYSLIRARLEDVDLVRHGSREGYSLTNADLFRANLQSAHLFHVNFSGASLMKANLMHANLHNANLTRCNLLGAKFEGAKIENVIWGEQLLQEEKGWQALKEHHIDKSIDFFQQAEEIYRSLRKVSEFGGLFENAGHFFIKEMRMRRMQKPQFSVERMVSKMVDLFCGYGEKPLRVIGFSLIVIFTCAVLFAVLGIDDGGNRIQFARSASTWENLMALADCVYFSVITFTTLGYGDLVPIGFSRMVSAMEAFMGSFTLALFVVVFVKKMTR